jgi:thiosulfate dehydrogenase [quinone] large subunit
MHGWVRIKNGEQIFIEALLNEFSKSGIPLRMIRLFGSVLPYAELIIGALLIVGLFTQSTLIAGCLLMYLLLFGKSMVSDWHVVSLQMIYLLIYCILLYGLHLNKLSADGWIGLN